jgi:hypothetical protein
MHLAVDLTIYSALEGNPVGLAKYFKHALAVCCEIT